MADRSRWWRVSWPVVGVPLTVCVFGAGLGVGMRAIAQPVSPPPRAVDIEVVQSARAACEYQLASMLEQARSLQRQVDDLKKQLATKEMP